MKVNSVMIVIFFTASFSLPILFANENYSQCE
jgi:hypothetical protein